MICRDGSISSRHNRPYKSVTSSNGLIGTANQTAPANHLNPPLQNLYVVGVSRGSELRQVLPAGVMARGWVSIAASLKLGCTAWLLTPLGPISIASMIN